MGRDPVNAGLVGVQAEVKKGDSHKSGKVKVTATKSER